MTTPSLFSSRHSTAPGWGQDGAHRYPVILEIPCCRAQSCPPQWLMAWVGCSWLSQPSHTGTGLPAAPTAPSCFRAGVPCSQKPRAAVRATCHPRDPALPGLWPQIIHSAPLRLHISPSRENNKKAQKEALKKAFSVAARGALCEQIHQTCKQQVVHPMFVFHLQQGECA